MHEACEVWVVLTNEVPICEDNASYLITERVEELLGSGRWYWELSWNLSMSLIYGVAAIHLELLILLIAPRSCSCCSKVMALFPTVSSGTNKAAQKGWSLLTALWILLFTAAFGASCRYLLLSLSVSTSGMLTQKHACFMFFLQDVEMLSYFILP